MTDKDALCTYRLQEAEETLSEAVRMLEAAFGPRSIVIDFCILHKIEHHIKKGTATSEAGTSNKTERTARLFEVCSL